MVSRDEFYKIAGVTQHTEFDNYLRDILFKPEEREKFYTQIIRTDSHLEYDTFKGYFEEYAAERKANQQDYTPDEISKILAMITRGEPAGMYAGYDPTAGTGSLLIQKWWDDVTQETLWSYAPHRYLYRADELADNVIPYLLHNLAIRGMNAIVVHGDTLERAAKQVYFVQNSHDDFMRYSDINVMPHDDVVLQEFGLSRWLQDPIRHIESVDIYYTHALPMRKKALEINPDYEPVEYQKQDGILQLKDVAAVERAKSKKVYPRGTVIIQMSATRGQIGLLTSSGRVGTQYACVLSPIIEPRFMFDMLKRYSPKHFRRVQEGLNLKLEDIQTIPVCFPL